jgi:hypothetical protein
MQGIWFKRCPRCGNYIKKINPEELCMCCACGWEETVLSHFCEIVHNYCTVTPKS